MIRSAALPAAASSPSLRRIVLTSGARSRPSTRPSARGRDPGGAFGPGLAGQGQEHHGQQRGGQPVVAVAEPAVDLAGGLQQPGCLQRGQRQQQPGQRVPGTGREDRLGALAEQPPPGQHPLPVPGHRIRQHRQRLARGRRLAVRLLRHAVLAGVTVRPPGPGRPDRTRPSALRTVNVDTPVAAAICRSVWPRRPAPRSGLPARASASTRPSARGGPGPARPPRPRPPPGPTARWWPDPPRTPPPPAPATRPAAGPAAPRPAVGPPRPRHPTRRWPARAPITSPPSSPVAGPPPGRSPPPRSAAAGEEPG